MFRRFVSEEAGQTATEHMLILAVVAIAVAFAGAQFVPIFSNAVTFLGHRVKWLLWTGRE